MTFEQQIHAMFDHIWDCEIEHPVFEDTVGDLMRAVIMCYKDLPPIDQEFITCKDCKYSVGEPIEDGRYWCPILDGFMYYCSDAKRE